MIAVHAQPTSLHEIIVVGEAKNAASGNGPRVLVVTLFVTLRQLYVAGADADALPVGQVMRDKRRDAGLITGRRRGALRSGGGSGDQQERGYRCFHVDLSRSMSAICTGSLKVRPSNMA